MNISKQIALLMNYTSIIFLLVIKFNEGINYPAPEDCNWIALNNNDVSLTCHLQTIVASGILATNFSLIQSESTAALTIICDSFLSESHLAPMSFVHLRYLKTLNLIQCKLRDLPNDTFMGLDDMRNLTIQTMNDDWGQFSLNLDADTFSNLLQLETLDLSFNKIRILPDLAICHLSLLKVLNLSHNDLTSIISFSNSSDNGMNRHCVRSLSELDVSYNKISAITTEDLHIFKRLRVLNLAQNYIHETDPFLFKNCENLQVIDLSSNMLTRIPALLFQDSPDLRELYLQNNSIPSLPFSLFNGLQQLLILNLSSNYIFSGLNSDLFVDLIRLVILDLSQNEIISINNTLFQSQYSLQMLFLSHNKIQFIEDNSFSSLYNLYSLDLSHNQLEYLDAFTLNGLYVLSDLNLSFNNISNIHPDTFKNCSTLEELTLESNRLNSLPIALTALQFLKKLNLNKNFVSSLYNSSLSMLKQIYHISLSQNEIGNLTREAFREMPTLKELDLSKNQIYNLEHGTFDEADALAKINLCDNYLTDMNGLFMNLKKLRFLNVSRNNILWFDYAIIPVELESLDLHSNEIEIIGNYYELESTLQLRQIDASFNRLIEVNGASFPNQVRIIKINNNRIKAVNPLTFTAKNNLTFVDMSNNYIENLDINTFRLNHNILKKPLPQFAIAGNPFFCNCDMEWLHRINKLDGSILYPHIIDFDKVICKLSFARPHSSLLLSKSKSSDFLCNYGSHCFALCHCCEFDACDCEMVCPDECTCYADQTWNVNIVECSAQDFSAIPSVIPMDVTDLYLDGNNIFQLTSHAFIGRKNMRVLFLNDSKVHIINNRTFNGLSILRILHLENNQLSTLHGYEFETLIHLKELYLSNNRINYIANITFQNLKMLTILHLDNNFIKEFQVWNLNWNTGLSSVRLANNSWICNCDYLELYHEWLYSTSSRIEDLSSIKCQYNQSSGLYFIAFNESSCFKSNATNFFEINFQFTYYIVIPLAIFVLVLFITIVICVYRHEIKVWLYTKYGIRLFKRNNFTPEPEKLFDAFVSYNKKDESFVSQVLAPELEYGAPSYRLCLRYRDLPMSEYVAEAVTEAIECSHRTIIVLSEQYLKSDWCRFELTSAHRESQNNRQHKLLIAVLGTISFKAIDAEAKLCFCNAHIVHYGDKRFWQKLRYAMPKNNQAMLIR